MLFEVIRETNRALDGGGLSRGQARFVLDWWNRINRILALEADEEALPAEVQSLLDARATARATRQWKQSDELREQIAGLGWEVKDTKDGQKASRRAKLANV